MSRRALTLLVAGIGAAVLALAGAVLPVPYVVLSPGPTFNTLGTENGKPLITVSGHKVYPTAGHLNLVTVSFQGGPGDEIDLYHGAQRLAVTARRGRAAGGSCSAPARTCSRFSSRTSRR